MRYKWEVTITFYDKSEEEEWIMYFAKKSEYNDIREKSFLQWLDEMEKHDDVAVRCGVKLAREYMHYLKDENEKLREENELKNSYLKKMKITNK